MLSFKSEKERQQWVIDHADYFTVVRFKNRSYIHAAAPNEVKTLAEAETLATKLVATHPDSRWMIYAVAPHISTFVKVIQ